MRLMEFGSEDVRLAVRCQQSGAAVQWAALAQGC